MTLPLCVVVYSDGRPGHEKQTLSVVAALKDLTPLSVSTRRLAQTAGIRRIFQGLGAFLIPEKTSLKTSIADIDLIIGTGSTTHLPMIALKRRSRAKLVICMSPDPLILRGFDLCLVPRHDSPPERRNIFKTFGPPCSRMRGADHDPLKGLILTGGIDPKSHHWDTSVFMSQIQELGSRMPEMTWTISSSPRTPADTIEQLRDLSEKNPRVHFVSVDETPRGWVEEAYQTHGQVWVTADSVSMVYEALTAGCRVGILPVAWKSAGNKFQRGIDDLSGHGLIIDFDQWQKGRQWPLMTPPLNEAARCALEILRRWWPERLP